MIRHISRQHQSRFYSSDGLRHLQAQIDELWGIMQKLGLPSMQVAGDVVVPPGSTTLGRGAAAQAAPVDPDKHQEHLAPIHKALYPDAAVHAATAEVADALKPDMFHVKHLGHGWYQVVTNGLGQPIHEGKLRKKPAQEVWQAAMEGA